MMKLIAGVFFLSVMAALAGCGEGSSDVNNYDVNVAAGGNCLNLENVMGRLRQFPATAQARQFTNNVQAKSNDSKAAMVAAKGAFTYYEGPLTDLMTGFPAVKQTACQTVTFENGAENEVYQIKNASLNEITLEGPEGRLKIYRLIDSQMLQEESHYKSLNPCGALDEIQMTTVHTLRWGSAGEMNAIRQENVSGDLLQKVKTAVAKSGASLPGPQPTADIPGVMRLQNDGTSTDSSTTDQTVDVEELKRLAETPIDPSYLYCAPRSGTPVTVSTDDTLDEDDQWHGAPRGEGPDSDASSRSGGRLPPNPGGPGNGSAAPRSGSGNNPPPAPTPTPTPTPPPPGGGSGGIR